MQDSVEDGFYSIGELLPVFSLGLILLSLLEKCKCNFKRSKDEKEVEAIGFQRV